MTAKKRWNVKKWELIKNWPYYVMILPVIVLFFVFAYLPIPGVILAFKSYTIDGGIFGSPWVGLANFKMFFLGTAFLRTTRNVVLINTANIFFGMTCSIACALLINQLFSGKMQKIYQNILFLPTFFSALLVAKFFNLMLSNDKGLINVFLQSIGLDPVMWYNNSIYWIPIVVIAGIWKGLGYNIIVYLASISGIDEEIYEAAKLDGAGRVKQVFHITLPLLRPTIIMLLLLSIGRIFYGDFLFIYAFVGDNYVLQETLDIIETYLFRGVIGGSNLSSTPDYGMSAAIGLYQTLLGFLVIFGSNLIVRKIDKDSALF